MVPPEVPQDTRKCIEDMEISQFEVKSEVRLIDEVGALLTESGGAQIIETFTPNRFAAKAGDLRLRPGFAVDLCENKPYGPHEGECWDLSENSDVKELTLRDDRF